MKNIARSAPRSWHCNPFTDSRLDIAVMVLLTFLLGSCEDADPEGDVQHE